ncbi:MAG: dihydroorotate dehydrogenase [Deltaproteobacteria bacterium]|nr:dihydroorotate dehydrogenase [Deltaproteobacteria bacterium]
MGVKRDLSVDIAGLKLKNPVMTASGTFGYGLEFEPFFDIGDLGAVVVKGLSLKPKAGNPPPRIVETPAGMLNAIGLQNVGVDVFLEEKLPKLKQSKATVIVNFFGNTAHEYEELARKLDGVEGVHALEVNISCPNVKAGGIVFGTDPAVAHNLIKKIREKISLPLIVKLSPNVTDIKVMARAVEEAGADALSLINTLTGMAIDVRKGKSKLANMTGGLSGPAIRPVAVRMVWEAAEAVKVPIIGIGGIMKAEDALEFIIAGASAVQVGTASFVNPAAAMDIVKGMETFMEEENIEKITDLIGSVRN